MHWNLCFSSTKNYGAFWLVSWIRFFLSSCPHLEMIESLIDSVLLLVKQHFTILSHNILHLYIYTFAIWNAIVSSRKMVVFYTYLNTLAFQILYRIPGRKNQSGLEIQPTHSFNFINRIINLSYWDTISFSSCGPTNLHYLLWIAHFLFLGIFLALATSWRLTSFILFS